MKKKYKAKEGTDYVIDPITMRATFTRNNKAALTHGGHSVQVPEEIMQAALDTDLGFEVGLLKGQLANITTIGTELIHELYEDGEKAQALSVSLSCADRTARIVPQLVKALEQYTKATEGLTVKQKNARKRILKKLQNSDYTALEVAYLFELNELGDLPKFVVDLVQHEIKHLSNDEVDSGLSRHEIKELLNQYHDSQIQEVAIQATRENEVAQVKADIKQSMYSGESSNEKEK